MRLKILDWEEEEAPSTDQISTIGVHPSSIEPLAGSGAFGWFSRRVGGRDGVEAEFFRWRDGSGDELFDGFEDELELLVVVGVFFLEGFDFLGQECVGVHQAAELDEGAHDGDVHLHGAGGAEYAGEHGDALLGEGVGKIFAVLPTL